MSSSKACAGVPFHIMKNITLQDYKNALLEINEIKVNYNIIKNDKYVNKTISVSKQTLKPCCVKKYMKSESESYSFGFHKIPIHTRYNFISDDTISSNSNNTLENIQWTSDTSLNINSELSDFPFSDNNSSNISISSRESCVDIFKNRKEKMLKLNIFPNNTPILNSSPEDFSHENEFPQPFTSFTNNTPILNSSPEDFSYENEFPQPSTSKVKKKCKKKNKKKSNFILYEADASSLSSNNEENDINSYDLQDNFINDEISESSTSSNSPKIEIEENSNNSHSDTNSETVFFQNMKRKQVSDNFSDESN